ncbi:MAG: Mrp/NBP35 family ATP-binding protein [Verrucomicrobiales bacterium]|nr:Mrp/NBP35 family ATP-binding protein [Verrucomicrobiales bacterium]
MVTEDSVRQALQTVKYPGYSRDIVSFGLVRELAVANDSVSVQIQLTSGTPELAQQLKGEAERAIKSVPGVRGMFVEVKLPATTPRGPAAPNPWTNQTRVPGIKRTVAVASGKGGVGKSTTSVNLACALRHLGAEVGLLDCDIYGPSIPLMMGIHQRPTVSPDEKLVPPANHGIKLMSMGFLLDGDSPVIWRGPMIMKTIQQFINAVEWGELDYLLVDLPPGTGDAQLSLCQTVPLDGGVIVTTPQEASLGVVRKGIAMFEKVNVPILGIIENMSYFTAPNGQRCEIFGHGGGRSMAEKQRVPFLGEIPIFTEIRESGDAGVPIVVSAPTSAPSKGFIGIAATLRKALG